jgi:hypothetical protein
MDKLIGIQVTDVTSIFGDNRFDIQANALKVTLH